MNVFFKLGIKFDVKDDIVFFVFFEKIRVWMIEYYFVFVSNYFVVNIIKMSWLFRNKICMNSV